MENQVLSLIEEFLESEKARLGWWDKFVGNNPEVTDTRQLATDIQPPVRPEKVIRPSISLRLAGVPFLLAGSFLWFMFIITMISGQLPWLLGMFFLLFISTWLVMVAGTFYFFKKYNYELRIDRWGIRVDGRLIHWDEIVDTAIMEKPGGRTTSTYLVLFLRDSPTLSLNLYMLATNKKKLSTVIEQYRPANA